MKTLPTEFIMVKGNLTCRTRHLIVVEALRLYGWVVKPSELGRLL